MQFSIAVRNARLDSVETTVGASAVLKLYDGSMPANCATADANNVLCSITLPTDWMNAAGSGEKTKLGTWSGTGAAAAGAGTDATHFRIFASDGTTCHWQGDVTGVGGGGDMELDNINIAQNQTVVVDSCTLTDGNA